MVALVGGTATGRSVLHAAADTIKRTIMQLSGKNALIAMPDADPDAVAAGMVKGMNGFNTYETMLRLGQGDYVQYTV